MDSCNKDLSEKLYALTKWETGYWWVSTPIGTDWIVDFYHLEDLKLRESSSEWIFWDIPAYDLEFVFDKLPPTYAMGYSLILMKGGNEHTFDYKVGYATTSIKDELLSWSDFRVEVEHEGAANAAAQLCLNLIEAGKLKP